MTIEYRPSKKGFPYKLLKYLYENGKSPGSSAQEEIGLNAWAAKKGPIFFDRANINFDSNVSRLREMGLIDKLPDDYYVLTKDGEEFMKNYNPR